MMLIFFFLRLSKNQITYSLDMGCLFRGTDIWKVLLFVILICRNQREEDLRENHPYFDTPLFAVGRESRFRKFCQLIVYSRYDTSHKDPITGKERKIKYKRLQ